MQKTTRKLTEVAAEQRLRSLGRKNDARRIACDDEDRRARRAQRNERRVSQRRLDLLPIDAGDDFRLAHRYALFNTYAARRGPADLIES